MFVIRREPHNPVLAPERERPWESISTFNPSAVRRPDGVRMFYRALGHPDALGALPQISTIGTAFAEDGIHFHSRKQVIAPREEWEMFGCEDPRATFFENRWYCFYTALGGYPFGPDNIKVALAIGDAAHTGSEGTPVFDERHLITPFNAKAATLFPERVNGDVVMILTAHTDWTAEHQRPAIAIARAKKVEDFFDQAYWNEWHSHLSEHALPGLLRCNDDAIEVGAAPLLTEKGWLLFYSYIQDYYGGKNRTFSVEAALFDRDDPQKMVSRTESIIVPQEFYEVYGIVPNVVFPSGATMNNGSVELWYGAADTVCAKATVKTADILRDLDPKQPARTFIRAKENPILTPAGDGFDGCEVMNAASIDIDGSVYLLYRAMDVSNTSTIGLAISKNGITVDERLPQPIYAPRADFEMKHGSPAGNSGCEDPRIVRMNDPSDPNGAGTLYMTYTAYDGVRPPAGAISSIRVEDFLSRRFEKWSAPFILTPEGVDDKDLALLPEKINGQYLLYHRINNQICADLLPDLSSDKRASRGIEVIAPRHGMWDGIKVGCTAPPIKVALKKDSGTEYGWLMIYHGVSRHATYRFGAALLGADGVTLLARTADSIFEPIEKYEREGLVQNVVFSCGTVVRGDTVFLYYGAADKVLGVATGSLVHLVEALS